MIDNAVHHLHSKLTKCKSESDPDSSVAFPLIARSCNEEFTYDGHYCKKDQRKFAKRINSGFVILASGLSSSELNIPESMDRLTNHGRAIWQRNALILHLPSIGGRIGQVLQ